MLLGCKASVFRVRRQTVEIIEDEKTRKECQARVVHSLKHLNYNCYNSREFEARLRHAATGKLSLSTQQ